MNCDCMYGTCDCSECHRRKRWRRRFSPLEKIRGAPWCVYCGGTGVAHCCEPDEMTEAQMIIQGLREAVDYSSERNDD